MAKVSVIGAGSWGTALAVVLNNNGHQVTIWSAIEEEIQMLKEKREHVAKLPGVKLAEGIELTADLKKAAAERDLLVLAVPSVYTRSTAADMKPLVQEQQLIVNVAKGIEEKTLMTLTDIIEEEIPQARAAVLSGPSHAEEVGKGLPTTCVAGARTCISSLYLFRYAGHRIRRSFKKCDCSCSRDGRWSWLW